MRSTARVRDHLDRKTPDVLIAISRLGIAARAVILGVIGGSLIRAAILYNPNAARGTSGAQRQIAAMPFGGWMLMIIGAGLIAYGVYAFINARYRRIKALPAAGATHSR